MITVRTVQELRGRVADARSAGATVGLVPTMGFLHDGHLSLVEVARSRGAGFVVVSIFVNPTQFGPKEDFSSYPRDEERDRSLLEQRGVDLLFAPPVEEVYPPGARTTVHVSGVSDPLEGARRPGHFDGVATVVLKLFQMALPDLAVFGQKDAQQYAVIRRMTQDLDLPVQLYFGPTIRERDGLAMSSRNWYLTEEQRALAPELFRALEAGADALRRGAQDAEAVERIMALVIEEYPEIELDYLAVVDPETFRHPADLQRDLLVVGAVRFGSTRLIDNIPIPNMPVERKRRQSVLQETQS